VYLFLTQQTKPRSLLNTAHHVWKTQGILRFWRGLGPAVVGGFPGQASYYLALESTQELFNFLSIPDTNNFNTFLRGFFSGAAAELAGGLFFVPSDSVSQRLQVQNTRGFSHNKRLYSSSFDVIRRILTNDGVRGFYRGYLAYISAYAPASAIQWGSYELSKTVLYSLFLLVDKHPTGTDQTAGKKLAVHVISGGIAATLAICSNNPLEVLRIRTQLLESKSKLDAETISGGYYKMGLRILRQEGWRAFYKGLKVRLLVTVPSAMVALSGYDTIKDLSFNN
jgi:hypothetical protein